MKSLEFPRHLDDPQPILFWTLDQIIPFATFVVIGMAINRLILCMLIGAVAGWLFTRYRDSKPDGYFIHMTWFYGLLPLKGRACINPFLRTIYPA